MVKIDNLKVKRKMRRDLNSDDQMKSVKNNAITRLHQKQMRKVSKFVRKMK